MIYTKRRNLNRGNMTLETWQRAMELFRLTFKITRQVPDYKLRSQLVDSAQSVSANISEGYCRRSLPEYLQFLYIAKGSLGECLTRLIGLFVACAITEKQFDALDALHYEVENKLLSLIRSIESKRETNTWNDSLPAALSGTKSN